MATWHEKTQRWVASKTIAGQRRWFYSKGSEADADRQAREAKSPTPIFEADTFAGFVYGPWKANTWPDLRPMSRVKYNGQLKAHILPILGHLPLTWIGLDEMLALKSSLTLKPKHKEGRMSSRTAHDILSLTLGILTLAKNSGKTHREDWRLVKLPKIVRKTVRPEPEEDFTQVLLKAAAGDWMAGPLFSALFLGLRRGETAGLKWSAIDRKRLTVTIDTQRQRQSGKGTVEAKTKGAARVLYVNEEIIGWLDRLGNQGSIYVFTGYEGFPMRPDRITKAMGRICRKAEVPQTTYHTLRSYAASNLAALGVPEGVIKSILGHVDLATTRLYIDTKRAQIQDALGKLLGSLEEAG